MPQTPSDILVEFLPQILPSLPAYKALDIACGNGRNSKYLAKHNILCDSVDISQVALDFFKDTPNIRTICTDLDTYIPPINTYGLALNFYFLNRNLFPHIINSLKPKGFFILETFTKEDNGENITDIPDEKILNPNELKETFQDFTIYLHQSSYIQRREGQKVKVISFIAQKP